MEAQDEATPGMTLPTRLDTAAARPLQAALMERRGTDLRLDAAGVEQLGGLCLQVLLAAAATWHGEGRLLEVHSLSAAASAGLEQFGVRPATPPFSKEIVS